MRRTWQRLADVLLHRPGAVLALVVLLAGALAVGLPRLDFETDEAAMIPPGSVVYRENLRYQGSFGGEAMLVLYTGDVATITSADNLLRLEETERALRATGRFHSVIGPVTALRFAEQQLAVAPELLLRAAERDPAAGVEE